MSELTKEEQEFVDGLPGKKIPPLLSDEQLDKMFPDDTYTEAAGDKVRDFYEAKIASGELRVVNKVQWFVGTSDHGDAEIKCNSCFNAVDPDDIFCRTCGGEIEGKQSDNS